MPWLHKSCGRTGTTTNSFHRSPGWSPSPLRLTGRTRSSKSAVRIQLRSRHGNDNRSGRIRRSSSSSMRVGHLRGLLPPLHPLSVHQHLTPSSRAEPSKPSFLPSFLPSSPPDSPPRPIFVFFFCLPGSSSINPQIHVAKSATTAHRLHLPSGQKKASKILRPSSPSRPQLVPKLAKLGCSRSTLEPMAMTEKKASPSNAIANATTALCRFPFVGRTLARSLKQDTPALSARTCTLPGGRPPGCARSLDSPPSLLPYNRARRYVRRGGGGGGGVSFFYFAKLGYFPFFVYKFEVFFCNIGFFLSFYGAKLRGFFFPFDILFW